MPSYTRTSAYTRSRTGRGTVDHRQVAANFNSDGGYIPRLAWKSDARSERKAGQLASLMQRARDASFFIDNSYIDDSTDPDELKELLRLPGRLHVVSPVARELEPFLHRRPSHPLAVALREEDPAIVTDAGFGRDSPGRIAFEHYVALLLRRRYAADFMRMKMAAEDRTAPEAQDPKLVFDRVQREYGERARMIAEKPPGPYATDEVLVYLATEHALRTGRETVILTKDADLEEQFFKLTWMLCSHYKAMHCADQYAADFASFRTIPVAKGPADEANDWPIEPQGAVLIDASRWGDSQQDVLPSSYRFVALSSWNTGAKTSQIIFGAEQEMARVLDVKDRTRGRATDQLGSRNFHVRVPATMKPATVSGRWVLVARDRSLPLLGSRSNVPLLDISEAVFSDEHPRRVQLDVRPAIVQAADLRVVVLC